jgi:hypothetical protein
MSVEARVGGDDKKGLETLQVEYAREGGRG